MRAALLAFLAGFACAGWAQEGRGLIEDSLRRHAPSPYVYQEQTLILSDSLGQNTVRTARFYGRNDPAGGRRLLVIDTPADLRGAAVYVSRDAQGGARLGPDPASPVFGSDYTVADFEGEQPRDFAYVLEESQDLDRVSHHVLRATPKDAAVARATGYGVRRLYLRKDNLFVSRIDYLDRQGRLAKRRTFRNPSPDETGAWRAGMILTEDLLEDRRTLIKVERRVHSADYIPEGIFPGSRGAQRAQLR